MIKKIAITFGVLHLSFVIFMAYVIATSSDPVAVNAWLLFIPLDFPISLGMFPVSYIFDGNWLLSSIDENGNYNIFRDINNFWVPAIYTGIVGTAWWYYLPILFHKFVLLIKTKKG
ncbi:hypothetical protein [Shewanella acanthi]|uniref:hypothetical protein n=1 Tax=Shewanella acanthi TaxID=2864212 RepID=UPI001C656D1E|nr:hypothetical protein [Shewanella acanthi]QYJ78264.1 hypothetical protein K0H61_14300 [Shewanella acanthi]